MSMESIVYEFPLYEHVRTCLRLEKLWQKARFFLDGQSSHDSRMALHAMLEAQDIMDRCDIRLKLSKEMRRFSSDLAQLGNVPDIDKTQLNEVIDCLNHYVTSLQSNSGQLGLRYQESELLQSIKQQFNTPGGGCSFDSPYYHYWLQQDIQQRNQDLTTWFGHFATLESAVGLLLKLIRQSTSPTQQMALAGLYQETLTPHLPYQLIQLIVPENLAAVPEVSAGRHRIVIRFHSITQNKIIFCNKDVAFQLNCCTI